MLRPKILEIYNSSNAKIAQNYYEEQNFSSGQTLIYTWSYTVPSSTIPGAYTLKLGVFTANWGSNPYWNNSVTSYSVAGGSRINGQCGSANGRTLPSAPTTNLCSIGAPSAVSGTGPWSWTCAGSNGGTSASCSADRQQSNSQIPAGWPVNFVLAVHVWNPNSQFSYLSAQGGPKYAAAFMSGANWDLFFSDIAFGDAGAPRWNLVECDQHTLPKFQCPKQLGSSLYHFCG